MKKYEPKPEDFKETVEVRVYAQRTVRYSQVIEISKYDLAMYKQAAKDDDYTGMHDAVDEYLDHASADWEELEDVVVEPARPSRRTKKEKAK